MTRKTPATTTDLTEQSVALAEFAAQALIDAEHLRVKTKVIDAFPLDDAERSFAAKLPAVTAPLRKKLKSKNGTFTVAETGGLVMAVSQSLIDGDPLQLLKLLFIAKKLTDSLQDNVVPAPPARGRKSKPTGGLFQFKITLLGAKPSIWRRIQVKDCTLDKLHEHIQTAMGWANSHLHQFDINGDRYGDPELLDDGFGDFECEDSTKTMLSDILPRTGEHFAFLYEYDFGDGWEHEVLFESSPPVDPKAKYPVCLEGQRACPPDDCGGVWGYADLLAAISDKKHPEHKDMMESIGGRFDPAAFDPDAATKQMKEGVFDWRV